MPKKSLVIAVTPAQAHWIVVRLIEERRISASDVRGLLSELGNEIAGIEQRLARLRASAGGTQGAAPRLPSEAPASKKRRRPSQGKKGHVRGIAGTLAVLLRSIPAAEHAAIAEIRAHKGLKAAIEAAHAAMKKR